MNDGTTSVIECQVSLEYLDPGKSFVARKTNIKKCTLRLIRNEFREILLDISERNKQILRQELKNVCVHKKFVKEGKAAIKFEKNNLNVLISNAPSSQLMMFLRHMFIKVVNDEKNVTTARDKFISSKKPYLEDISPLTKMDVENANKKFNACDSAEKKNNLKRPLRDRSEVKAKKNCLLQAVCHRLSEEQRHILEVVKSGDSIFFTGSAGTGKSHLLKGIIASLPPETTFATASTAIAACQIGGTTLHQFAGIGKGDGSFEQCLALASRSKAQAVWKKCQHLIIDEISMVHGEFFEKLERISRCIRKNDKPFGGIQLIICGDFFQLPPVSNHTVFCFQTKAWEKCIKRMFELKEIHRQSDPVLINILQNIRVGQVTDYVTNQLRKTAKQSIERNGILATRLCTHTAESVELNIRKLRELPGEAKVFNAVDTPEALSTLIDKQCRVGSKVILKVGAQVMLLKNLNISKGLVNGARGVVVKFCTDGLPIVQFSSVICKINREKFMTKNTSGVPLSRVQLPLTLAWAFSIHKSQGLTLDCIELSLSTVFEPGHAYVALSRVKRLDCLRVLDFNKSQVWANKDVVSFYKSFKEKIKDKGTFPLYSDNS